MNEPTTTQTKPEAGQTLAPTACYASWHVYQLNDCDWWLARTLDEAKASATEYYGGPKWAEEMIDADARELTDKELDERKFTLGDNGSVWECDCGVVMEHGSVRCFQPDMRWNGSGWEHCHEYPIGHVPMRNKITFREELNRRIKAGAKPEMFASSEQ